MGVGVVVMDGVTATVVAVAVAVGVGLVGIPKEIGVLLVQATVEGGVLNSQAFFMTTSWHLSVLVVGNSYQFLLFVVSLQLVSG